MLLAPFALADSRLRPRSRRSSTSRRPLRAPLPVWNVTWLVLGTLGLLAIPPLRGGNFSGWTMPFWLVVAPLVNLLWLSRARWSTPLQGWIAGRRRSSR